MYLKIDDVISAPFQSFTGGEMSKKIIFFPNEKSARPMILIVEDDEDTRIMLRYLLEIWNYRVIEAVSGEAALELLAEQRPDLILMDYKLPKIDGLTTTERIRGLSVYDRTAIIFVSADSHQNVRESALAAGADDYLVKPIDFGQLEISLEKHLALKKQKASEASRL